MVTIAVRIAAMAGVVAANSMPCAGLPAASGLVLALASATAAKAQEEPAAAVPAAPLAAPVPPKPKPKPRKPAPKKPAAAAVKPIASPAATTAPSPAAAPIEPPAATQAPSPAPLQPGAVPGPAAETVPTAPTDYTKQLRDGGVAACTARVQGLAEATANGVVLSGAVSNWHATAANERIVSVLVGQKFSVSNVPFGVTGLFAAPAPGGQCDGYSIQIIPSPLSCADLERSVLTSGKTLGNLAGVPLLQDASGNQVTLLPTAGNGCVVIGLRASYTP